MGERVHVRTVRAEPVEGSAQVNYARPDVNPKFPALQKFLADARWAWDEFHGALKPRVESLVREIGGARQIGFAIGMTLALGGFGTAVSRDNGGGAFLMAVGGLLIGLCVRVTGNDENKKG